MAAGEQVAIDAELTAQPVPAALQRRFQPTDPDEFWQTWTRVEVSCKLLDIPLLAWLDTHGLRPSEQLEIITRQLHGATVSFAIRSNQQDQGV